MSKFVYFFGKDVTDGNGSMKDLLGGKGAGLAEMANLGVPVPPGFTITTEVCVLYLKEKKYPDEVLKQIDEAIDKLETLNNKKLGDPEDPLLVSVRSGARVSMPGMMDTVLNLGLTDKSVIGLANKVNDERFAYDCYRRFISMFGDVVLGVDFSKFESLIEDKKKELKVESDTDLDAKALKELAERFKEVIRLEKGFEFPQDPRVQLQMAINAVFESWNNPRAITYRKLNGIDDSWGTAVNVQTMVYGNRGNTSGTGVAFTRNPSTGEKKFFGEYLINAQGEDVVAGIRTPDFIDTLGDKIPEAYNQLVDICQKLEAHFKDMQDIEFTIQEGKLYMLQTRTGKRTAAAAVKIAKDMVEEGLIDKETAITRVKAEHIDLLLHPRIDPNAKLEVVARGLPASPGAAVGKVVFTAEEAEEMAEIGEKTILVRTETSPEDIGGMAAAQGVLTVRGGMTSHAAVVGRGMGKPCVVGCGEITIDTKNNLFMVNGQIVKKHDYITIDGSTGNVIIGKVDLIDAEINEDLKQILLWADEIRTLGVRTNADTPADASLARELGAEGIGLCRTEHMFFGEDRIPVVREMIMAEDEKTRKKALKKLLPMQKEDFLGIFRSMEGLPVTIRLLDPPLHEFLPDKEELDAKLRELEASGDCGKIEEVKKLIQRVTSLKELNPMLGHRGCRLGITYPEIYNMQVRAIMEAACELANEGVKVIPEIMIPLVGLVKELSVTREDVRKMAETVMAEKGVKIDYKVGTMIELPRAAITADQIAKEADFFSFGTNDLTQTTFGFSRDDVSKFVPIYQKAGILEHDPFAVLDQEGVGEIMKIGIEKARSVKPDLKMGICGEHGGEPRSICFAHEIGLDYVSCSPYRVPIARLVAAQSTIRMKNKK
ncbi:pyruvate phosphate dikinase [Methanosarcina thermophila]|uniref:pyruvate, phosphate dikinase n=3 Tax=Methanosarcina thermophila TaxID=2210 RepID=A0A0E3NHV3_METTE|nr:pyruvate, phosphate dikinase [Methanosarcina thermophila]ALK05126.1 MAG: pyruvate phosphate dikinase [Methanosarcina sp. 795]AKB13880.1 Pyruvate,phosphate dikinase [Methanosarcina thermophila TM-1]AKB15480.1 Pyruvate,phosphate dikinase [Methanosarcina thermophila CHTI-55]NLU56349.1 pyruvate, phosphate dikinase [Methanosarcina thermophila]SFT53069.1 pyruvate phosphate dikinase [Methanosarcina thermophila]